MVQILMILVYASIYLHDDMGDSLHTIGPDPAVYPLRIAGITLAGFYAIWGFFHLLASRCGSQIDATGRVHWVKTAEQGMTLSRIAAALWWLFCLFELGWLKVVRNTIGDLVLIDELIAIAPFFAVLAGCWWSIFPVERRMHEALLWRELHDPHGHTIHPPPTRAQYVWLSIRHQALLWMVPLTLLMGWQEVLNFEFKPIIAFIDRLSPGHGEDLFPIVQWLGTLSLVLVTPALMRFVWDTVAIGPGPLRDQVQAMCKRYRVRVGGPLLWRTHGTMVNGAILGIFWPLRFMLLTDALLERLTPSQVEAVMAHEVAHVRRRHLIWLGVCVISTVMVGVWAIGAAAGLFEKVVKVHPNDEALSILATVIALGGAGLVFGMVSRRFEWQADAFAAQHMSQKEKGSEERRDEVRPNDGMYPAPTAPSLPSSVPSSSLPSSAPRVTREAVAVMASALQAVADLNGISATRFSWRHGSIRQRQQRLLSLVDVPVAKAPIDRQVRLIKLAAAAALLAVLASMVWELLHQTPIAH